MANRTRYFIIPGLGNSGPQHWQTYFEASGPDFKRIEQREWDSPDCQEWIATMEKALSGVNLEEVVLIGHSLGCVTITRWAATYQHHIKGALLVAPSDVDTPHYATFPTTGFVPMPLHALPFKSIVVTSNNDPWVTLERARQFSDAWGSELVDIGPAGHINTASGHGQWPEGLALLKRLS